jgi:hypothetical protein
MIEAAKHVTDPLIARRILTATACIGTEQTIERADPARTTLSLNAEAIPTHRIESGLTSNHI